MIAAGLACLQLGPRGPLYRYETRGLASIAADGANRWLPARHLAREPASKHVLVCCCSVRLCVFTAYRHASTLVQLEAGDIISCLANHQSTSPAAPQAIGGTGNGISTFEGHLVLAADEGAP